MDSIQIFITVGLTAYIAQVLLGFQQIKNFGRIYSKLRLKGEVVIGKKSGKFFAGSIVIFSIDQQGTILDSWIMKGVTIFSRFKESYKYNNINLMGADLDRLLKTENWLIRKSVLNAKDNYLKVKNGEVEDLDQVPVNPLTIKIDLLKNKLKAITWREQK
ncbi:transcriptional regulator GutM [Lactobacillus sp. ESL0731]|uniref:transcriptional regulator GutM n=1 Tax=unclassified Lactobacillus TaxID=2620435 RepID=UPI0023F95594|nr:MULTISPECIES: transcriptional regulator GutM [unclassified Lactobacillus]WEV50405.1 transcriptional regulator GutM [Lactobacillus sp. ESL0700]WEV61535.1 transcriptional regulator GutM [Lactobacillus sp. ESL0731]